MSLNSVKTLQPFCDYILTEMNVAGLKIDLYFDERFGSSHELHRHLIRQNILSRYKNYFNPEDARNCLDLSRLPRCTDRSFSISHAPKMGGFVASTHVVGLDIEALQRVQLKTLQRVCSAQELIQLDNFESTACLNPSTLKPLLVLDYKTTLWTAKEVCFKALNLNHKSSSTQPPQVISEIDIRFDRVMSLNETPVMTFHCEFKNNTLLKYNRGFSTQFSNHICTVFFL